MATLTWQDVAGQVRAPDYSEAASLITQGISGIGDSVKALGTASEQRRQAALVKEMMLVDMEAQGLQQRADLGMQLGKDLAVRTEKKDMKEFSKNQSFLEAGARKAALAGMSLDDYLANDKIFQSMGEGAKTYSASHLSDAYMRGDETRLSREEQAADNARQERHFQIQLSESRRQQAAANSRFEREFKLRERELTERKRQERENAGYISDDPLTNVAWRQRAAQTQKQLAPLQRAVELYGDMTPQEAAIKGGIVSSGKEAQAIAQQLEKKTGKKVETWMINQLLAEGGGANSIIPLNDFNNSAAEDYLMSLVKQTDAAKYNQQFFDEMTQLAREGKTYSPERMADFPIRTGINIDPELTKKATPSGKTRPGQPGKMY